MRVLQLTPGTGNFYCGSCLRDNTLVHGLRAKGHEVLMVPLYLPLVTDEPPADEDSPIFLGGISVFLEQKLAVFRHTPEWLNRWLSSPALLRLAANLAGMTTAKQLGESAVSMLQSEHSRQAQEVERLLTWLRTQPKPDLICLSNSLLGGLARRLKEELRVPIVSTLQGEDSFLDALAEPYRTQCWELLAQRCAEMDHFVAVSGYYAELMRKRLDLPAAKLSVIYPGIRVEDYSPAPQEPQPPAIGYLARIHPFKGLDRLVDAFIKLKQWNRVPRLRLRVAGAMAGTDSAFADSMKRRLGGLLNEVDFLPNLDRNQKIEFLRTIRVLSVPAMYGEAFGLYLLEAWASGVPVVQPRHAAFPELVEQTRGGTLFDPDAPDGLAQALEALLLDPAKARQMGEAGHQKVQRQFAAQIMTNQTEELFQRVIHAA